MTFLLDVNVLDALIVPNHVAHDRFANIGQQSRATCPMIETGVIRIPGTRTRQGQLPLLSIFLAR
ncbi:MAG: hypothetical protein Q4G14_01325 [Paracoccus sp. (in: a-proteobacteria)]|uniref:hypothetical protein n=1 Tax=Paracoccus sp. TaxID=267 RepID=UPI0026DFC09C|nr:hypothetical protein [Paracoccus sp. (in: a-proteobacteria)]MDO5611866.1 hypothetical protein [Paracoccus sp. (in: a-proteobacteria)]